MNQWSKFHRSTGAPALLWAKLARRKRRFNFKWQALGAGVLLLASGCTISTTRNGWPGSYAPPGIPDAQNCVPFSFGQPTRFACDGGKVYTARELKDLREQKSKGVVASNY